MVPTYEIFSLLIQSYGMIGPFNVESKNIIGETKDGIFDCIETRNLTRETVTPDRVKNTNTSV
jgi:hypothetical protein